jgi:ABC-2 type transport system permease protein
MSTPSYAMRDSLTMLRRQLVHIVRYPIILFLIGGSVVFLLMFVYVFGGTLGAGLGGKAGGRAEYLAFVVPGILLLAVASSAQLTAISVAMDMSEGIIARFRTMSISRTAVLAGHVLSAVIQTLVAAAVTIGLALLMGYRPTADPLRWLAAFGLLTLAAFAITWLAVALGLVTKSVETASNLPAPLMMLPFLAGGFVPIASLAIGLRWFAEYQPFTPMVETVRGLLGGTPVGHAWWAAVAWCIGIALVGYFWARWLYERERTAG